MMIEKFFSVKKEYTQKSCYKVINILGLKLKFKQCEYITAKPNFYDTFYSNFRMFNYFVDRICTIKEQRWLIEKFFYRQHKYFPNLDNPKSFSEKIQFLKLYYRDPKILTCIDKYKVKDFVASKIGKEHIIPLLGAWDNVNDIDFDSLPNQFVLKVNWRDGGSAHVIKDKKTLNYDYMKSVLNDEMQPWSSSSYYAHFWAYKQIKPKIIAEKYIEQIDGQLYDYKFYCFNGEPKVILVVKDREKGVEHKLAFYDLEWNKLNIHRGNENLVTSAEKPKNFEKMIEISKILSKDFPFVRVDFYETKDQLYFGEMTFHPGDGILPYKPVEWDYKLGEYIDLDKMNREFLYSEGSEPLVAVERERERERERESNLSM